MEAEQSQNFNERLSQWVASQGFWFQVRYSLSGSGSKGTVLFHLLRIGFRLLVFLMVVAAAGWVYLVKRQTTQGYLEGFRSSLMHGLNATEAETMNVSHSHGQLSIGRLACQGGDSTFFTSLEARNLRCRMGILDGLRGPWDAGSVAISKAEIELRAGADDANSAAMIAKSLFPSNPRVIVNSVEITDCSFRWGYSDRTRGMIENSMVRILRHDGGMKITCRGGTFSQNWLRQLDIQTLVVSCDSAGVVFEKAEFKRGGATVDLSGLKIASGERPQVSGIAKIRKLAMEHALPSALKTFIEGSMSGDFLVSGSTNSVEGVGFEGRVVLDGQDTITLRERFHLLKALSVVDYSRNYHRLDFQEGGFRLKTTSGTLVLSDVDMKADDVFGLTGKVKVRPATPEEEAAAGNKPQGESNPLFKAEESSGGATDFSDSDSLAARRSELEAKRMKEGKENEESISLMARMGLNVGLRRLEAQSAERNSRSMRYEGALKISLSSDVFERTPRLAERFPVDPASKRVSLDVPVEGSIYEVTLKQAEEIYMQGRR